MLENSINKIDKLSPTFIDARNPKFIEKDGMYISSLLVVDYSNKFEDLIFKNIINEDVSMQMNVSFEKLDKYKTIKELTYHIGNSGAFLKESSENSSDSEIVGISHSGAKYIRKRMQVDNDELYVISTYISVMDKSLDLLFSNLEKIESICISNGLIVRKSNFRQLEGYKATLPIDNAHKIVKEITKRNVLSSGLVGTYPFILSSINDSEGTLLGKTIDSKSVIMINRFDREKYKNSNMAIFGTSGAGKSFFTKINIIREYLRNINQYVIDPEREYINLCKTLNGSIIKLGPSSKQYINIFDIRKHDIEEGYFSNKLLKLKAFFSLIFTDIKAEEYSLIEDSIIKIYENKGITFDDDSLFIKKEMHRKSGLLDTEKRNNFKTLSEMPILEELYEEMHKEKRLEKYVRMLKPFVHGALSFFNNKTNININNKLVVADIYDLGEENYKYGMSLFIEIFWNKIKEDRTQKKLIYIDEIWRIIGATSNEETASFVYVIFKTIRKYNGGAVAITQDINDLFSLNDGVFGRSIINNSSFKALFSLQEDNINILSKNINMTEKEKIEISNLSKGECILIAEDNRLLLECISNKLERKIIEE